MTVNRACTYKAVIASIDSMTVLTMTRSSAASAILLCLFCCRFASAETFLVEDGQSRSEIIIAEQAPRTTRLAARELQTYVEKITGARLDILTEPSGDVPTRIHVGTSPDTDRLGITGEGLQYGAYRIVSGEDWIVFIGDDTDFAPIEPWPRSNNDIVSGRMQQAWNEITGAHWGYPHSQLRKHYTGATGLFGTPNEQPVDQDGNVNVWGFDERGSYNAVCAFLRSLGVRWYLPGELGEIVPQTDSIALPEIDRIVRPDFPLRTVNFRFGVYGRDAADWAMRLGVRQPYGRQAAHGLHHMTHNEQTLNDHPDWFALYGGERHVQTGQRLNQLCYSNGELLQESIRYVRAQFDHFDMDVVSVMPPDGYTAICQCGLCEGQESPERGYRGAFSDYVWKFVNDVAREVRQTHPDRMISCCAYGTYTLPPRNIDRLEPNVQVIIVGGRRPTSSDRDEIRQLREDWTTKTDNPIEIFENYPFTGRGFYLPAFMPRVLGQSINATKGISRGEDIWLTMDFSEDAIGLNHFLIYFTARMYWGGTEQDPVQMFDEYCDLFYGPAAREMRTFFTYCEEHWREMEHDHEMTDRALDLFAEAVATVDGDTVYGRRIGLIDQFLNGLRRKRIQLAQQRGPVPRLRLVSGSRGNVVVDGRLDDEPWESCPIASTGRMQELQTGRQPTCGTSFKTAWIGNDLYFAIRCEDRPGEELNVATDRNEDPAIWYGDAVEILLNTETHSYYQIVVNPSGARIDLDRGASRENWFRWDSQAEVATQVADDHWTVEIRIPVVQDDNDPLHLVIGRKPTQSLPWHVNLCRQRIRENGSEYSAFSPTGTAGFHEPLKFAHFYAGRSNEFPADATVTDYVIARRTATELQRNGKLDEALAAWVALAAAEDVTEYQVSDALQHAAQCARSLRDSEQADDLAARIPIESVAKTARMENLLAERDYDGLIERFGDEDFNSWPFWQIGAGAYARGRAHAGLDRGMDTERDLLTALEYTADARIRTSILLALGNNRETNLQEDALALEAYRRNFERAGRIGSADQFRSVQGAARILTRQGRFDEALAVLEYAETEIREGYWRHALLLSLGETLAVADRQSEALEVYRSVRDDDSASEGHRRHAGDAVREIEEQP